jgi:hypothetical protein
VLAEVIIGNGMGGKSPENAHPCKSRKDGPPNFKGKKASEKIPTAIPNA